MSQTVASISNRSQTMAEFARIVDQPFQWLGEVKRRSGRKLIGTFPMYVPHEMVDAAGMVPVNLYGGSSEMTVGAEYLQSIVCYPMRSAFEAMITGKLDGLDGTIIARVCTASSLGSGLWRSLAKQPYFHLLVIPAGAGRDGAVQYYSSQLKRLCQSLSNFGGKAVTAADLANSIKLYNRSRKVLQDLTKLSSEQPTVLPGPDLALVRAASGLMPRAEYVEMMSKLQAELAGKKGTGNADRVRLVMVGTLCDVPQFGVLSMIHEAGGVVVEDDSPLGRRMLAPVAENGDPIEALANYHFSGTPCPTKYPVSLDENFEYLRKLVADSKADGLIFLRPLYCDPPGIDYPMLRNRLDNAGTPTLMLDLDAREPASGQSQTRLQAFIEMLRR